MDGTGLLFAPFVRALSGFREPRVVEYPQDRKLSLLELSEIVLQRLPQEAVVVAESFSGLVALSLIQRAPSRLRGVVFVGAFAEPPRPMLARLAGALSPAASLASAIPAFFLRKYCLGEQAGAAELKIFRDAVSRVHPSVIAHRLGMISGTRFRKFGSGVPACYLRATRDRLVPAGCATWFEEHFDSCSVVDVPGPHFLLQANPEGCKQEIQSFLDRISA
ncbi:MAG TPA: alpha/beta hydrolase [Burkholderiales bacterium]|nr:alpha/beta hydrolase [Burkholderiales bacterium]